MISDYILGLFQFQFSYMYIWFMIILLLYFKSTFVYAYMISNYGTALLYFQFWCYNFWSGPSTTLIPNIYIYITFQFWCYISWSYLYPSSSFDAMYIYIYIYDPSFDHIFTSFYHIFISTPVLILRLYLCFYLLSIRDAMGFDHDLLQFSYDVIYVWLYDQTLALLWFQFWCYMTSDHIFTPALVSMPHTHIYIWILIMSSSQLQFCFYGFDNVFTSISVLMLWDLIMSLLHFSSDVI